MSDAFWRSIWNCPTQRDLLLGFECPQVWENLPDTGDPSIRHCGACQRSVHLCQSAEEFFAAGLQGHCVAIPREMRAINLKAHLVGQPSAESVAAFRAEMASRLELWVTVIERLPEALGRDLEAMRQRVPSRKQLEDWRKQLEEQPPIAPLL
jgi:hypothetical protein